MPVACDSERLINVSDSWKWQAFLPELLPTIFLRRQTAFVARKWRGYWRWGSGLTENPFRPSHFTRDDPHNLSFQTRLFRRFRIGSIYPTRHSGNSHDQPFQYSGFIAAIFLAKKYGSDIDDKVSRVRVLTQPGNRVLAAMLNKEKGRRPLRRKTGELQKAVGLHCFYNFQFVWDARRNAVNQITLYSTMALFERFE